MLFRQLLDAESSTLTYLIADPKTREAVIIDTVFEKHDRDAKLLRELDLKLKYILETHVHADHITGAHRLKEAFGARIALGAGSGVTCADDLLADGQTVKVGDITVKALATPGHTGGCTSYHVGNMVFTGDTLFIRGCGRTDFQQGSADLLYKSVHEKLFSLPDETLVYPGHDYNGQTASTIGEEKRHNPRLKTANSKDIFVGIMKGLKLADPKRIHEAVPANMECGRTWNPSPAVKP